MPATSTPSGPFAAISGPSTAAAGEVVVLYDASSPRPLRTDWQTPAGPRNAVSGISFSVSSPGCYTVSMTAYFQTGQVLSTSKVVAVGGVTCGG